MASHITSPTSPSKPPPLPSALHQQHHQQQGLPTGAISAPSPPFGTSHNSNRPPWLINLPPGPKDTPTQSVRKKHKSVRSLTREYESSATKENVTPDSLDAEGASALRSADSSSPSKAAASSETCSRLHARKSSVLLASSSYPSSFEVPSEQNGRTRPPPPGRIPSGGALPSSSSSEAGIRLASSAYPSTYSSATPPPVTAPQPLPAPPPSSQSCYSGDMPVSQDGPPVFSVSLDSPHSPAAGQSALPTLETPTRLGVRSRSSTSLGRSVSHGHSSSREWSGATNTTPERPRAVSAYDAAVRDEEGDTVGDLMRTQSTSARKPLSQMTPAERREHSRKHSRVHSRNLSVFFPQPGSAAEQEADQHRVDLNYSSDRPQICVDTSAAQARSNDTDYWSTTPESASIQTSPGQSRRGHHSKHSVSHGIFRPPSGSVPNRPGLYREESSESFVSFAPNGSPEALRSRSTSMNAGHDFQQHQSAHTHDHHDHTTHHHHAHASHEKATGALAALPYPLSIFAALPPLPPKLAPTLVFSLCHFVLGSALWVSGQSSDSLSVTGLGYLVVFDSLGIFNESLSRWILAAKSNLASRTQKVSSTYSMHRTSTLLNFVQVIYLLFAAVYVCKESIEHALLEGDDEAVITPTAAMGAAHPVTASLTGSASIVAGGGPGHHYHEEGLDGLELNLPIVKIALAVLACLFSNLVLGNHAKLVAASGISTTTSSPQTSSRRHSRSQSVLVTTANLTGPVLSLLSNPYTMSVLFFSTTLLFSALTMSPFQVAALDKVLAGLESVTMWYIALPASRVLGKVLLQTAPNINNEDEGGRTNTLQLMKAVKALEDHPLVHSTKSPHVWQLTPSTSAVNAAAGGASNSLALSSSSSSSSRTAKSPTLIASVRVVLHKHATDADILKVTKWAYQRCAPSVGAGMGVKVGEGLRGTMLAGDLVLDVRREGEEADETCGHDHHGHDHHGHDHHGHDHHGHEHNGHDHHGHEHHDHGHDHSHAHTSHSHSHSHVHAHAHAHDHGHAHSHDHSHSHDHYGHSHERDHYGGHHVALAPNEHSHDYDHDHDHKGHASQGHSHENESAHHHSGHSHSHLGHTSSAQQRFPSGQHIH